MGNYWLDLEKVEAEKKVEAKKSFVKIKSGYGHTLEMIDHTGESTHAEALSRAAEILITAPSHAFSLDGLELVQGPNAASESPSAVSDHIYPKTTYRTPIRLRAHMNDKYACNELRLREWLIGYNEGIPELSNVVLYVKNENNIQEAWVIEGVFPKKIEWNCANHTVEFSLGYADLKQRKVTRGDQ